MHRTRAWLLTWILGAAGCGNGSSPPLTPDVAAQESCTDGIDNDGNGLVDCADPACRPAYACVVAPAGWTIGSFQTGEAMPSCPAGYGPFLRVVGEPSTSATCACECGSSCGEVDCYDRGSPIPVALGGADAGCTDAATRAIPQQPACSPYGLDAGTSITFAAPAPLQGPVQTIATSEVVHPTALLCAVGATGGGCASGSVCVPRVSAPWNECVYQSMDVDHQPIPVDGTCPQAWIDSVTADGGVPAARAVATQWDESKACTDCECQYEPDAGCADAGLVLYADPSCQSPVVTVTPGTCTQVPAETQSARYTATAVNAGCTVVQPVQPTGIESSLPGAGIVVCSPQ